MSGRPPLPAALVDALVAHQRRVGAGPAAERAARALLDGATVVATGQQPGLLGGPLLSLHKAVGALAQARRRSRPGAPVVAVFWVASDDHDWDEMDTATVLDAAGAPRVLSLGVDGAGRSVADVPLDPAATGRVLDALAAALPATERGREALALARPSSETTDLATWSTEVLARVLGDVGLVFVEPRVLAPWSGPALAALVRHADAIGDAVRAEVGRRRAAGLAVPVDPRPDEAPLFVRSAPRGPRLRVGFDGARVRLRGEPSAFDRATLAAALERDPSLGSADVVGRVLLQDALLPVVAQVAGPTEAAYLAAVAPAHAVLGLGAPEVVARPSGAWADERALAALAEAGLDVRAVARGAPVPAAALEVATPDDDEAAALRRTADEVEAVLARLSREPGVAHALGGAVRGLRDAAEAHRRALGADAERAVARRRRAVEALRPRGRAQERVLSPVSIVARRGVEGVRQGLEAVAAADDFVVV